MLGKSVMTPRELIDHWKSNPKDLALSSVLRLSEGYSIPADELRELQDIDDRTRGVNTKYTESLHTPNIPRAYCTEASCCGEVVEDQSSEFGILDDGGASGVLLEGAGDTRRGAAAAKLLLAAQKRCMSNNVRFTDWPEVMDKCRCAPRYGDNSKAAILRDIQDSRVAVLHGIDTGITEKDAWLALENLLRVRNSNCRTTILTSSMSWPRLKSLATDKGYLLESLSTCIAFPGGRPNVVTL